MLSSILVFSNPKELYSVIYLFIPILKIFQFGMFLRLKIVVKKAT